MAKPIRIPSETTIGIITPEIMKAGEVSTWIMECEIPRNLPPKSHLNLILSGSRWIRSEMLCQNYDPSADNYVSAEIIGGSKLSGTSPTGSIDPKTLMRCIFNVPETGIKNGEKIRIILGDTSQGSRGLMGPRFAMRNTFFVLEIPELESELAHVPDYQGKYLAAFILDFVGGSMDNLKLIVPSQVKRDELFTAFIRVQDEFGNVSSQRPERIVLNVNNVEKVVLILDDMINSAGVIEIKDLVLRSIGISTLFIHDPATGLKAESNPVRVSEKQSLNLYWGLIHEHTEISDGQGSLELCYNNFRYGSYLDFAAVSDHDHAYETPDEMWKMTQKAAKEYHVPYEFVTFLGYEWAKWRRNGDGDRNVYYREDDRPRFRSEVGEEDTPPKLFEALSSEKAIVIPHHTAYTGNFCDWRDHDPKVERLVEIYSVWGSSEMSRNDGNLFPIRNPRWNDPRLLKHKGISPKDIHGQLPPDEEAVGFVQNALAQGWRVGFTAGGDMHRSHPGLDTKRGYPPTAYKPGVTGVWAKDKTRESIWEALYERRCFASSCSRMILKFSVEEQPMGSELKIEDMPHIVDSREINVYVHGTDSISKVEIVCNNHNIYSIIPEKDTSALSFTWNDNRKLQDITFAPAKWCSKTFTFYYIRVTQKDGEMAWGSPVWID